MAAAAAAAAASAGKARPPLYYLAIDVETLGPRFSDSVIALGAVFGPADGSWPRDRLCRFRGDLRPMAGDTADAHCLHDFWDKNREVLAEIRAAAESPYVVLRQFLGFCRGLVTEFEDTGKGEIALVTDCADTDIGRLHYLAEVKTRAWPTPLRALGTPGAWHHHTDPDERLASLGRHDACAKWIRANVPGVVYDHRPDHDAEYGYYQMVYLSKCAQAAAAAAADTMTC